MPHQRRLAACVAKLPQREKSDGSESKLAKLAQHYRCVQELKAQMEDARTQMDRATRDGEILRVRLSLATAQFLSFSQYDIMKSAVALRGAPG